MKQVKKLHLLSLAFLLVSFVYSSSKTWEQIHKSSKKSVVQIFSYISEFDWEKPFQKGYDYEISGSGFFTKIENKNSKENIYIITNYHVVKEAKSIYIQLPELGKQRFKVKVCLAIPDKDAAALKFSKKELIRFKKGLKKTFDSEKIPYLDLGNSDKLNPGQKITAFGFPLGHQNMKISKGSISGSGSHDGINIFHTDMAINSGNSGGPIIDKNGKVVGIVFARAGGNAQNIGYVLPITSIKETLEKLLDQSYDKKIIKKPYWGFELQPMTSDTLSFLGVPNIHSGIRISKIVKNSLFEDFGFKTGDIIFKIKIGNEHLEIDNFGDIKVSWNESKVSFYDLLNRLNIGESATIFLYRKEANLLKELVINIEATIKELPIKTIYPKLEEKNVDFEVFGGATFMELSINHLELLKNQIKNLAQEHDVLIYNPTIKYIFSENKSKSRLVITHIDGSSSISETRCFAKWDIIKKINGKKVYNLKNFREAINLSNKTKHLEIETKDGVYAAIPLSKI